MSMMLELSTAHITEETGNLLDDDAIEEVIAYSKDGWGWFVYVSPIDDYANMEIPHDIRDILVYAQEQGYSWVMLDGAADVIECEDLPIYR